MRLSDHIAAVILNLTLGRDEWPVLRSGLFNPLYNLPVPIK
jgi:hypothetical protein